MIKRYDDVTEIRSFGMSCTYFPSLNNIKEVVREKTEFKELVLLAIIRMSKGELKRLIPTF